jgi:ornithine carbamoyltransferase
MLTLAHLHGRHVLKEIDFTREELEMLLTLAAQLKQAKADGSEVPQLTGKEIALIFEKASTRTRCAFEVAAHDQGAHVTYLDPTGSQLGHKESIADTARVLSRMFDAIEYRGAGQENVEELARHSDVPVYNGLTNEWHPTQMLADFLTMREHTRKPSDEIRFAFLGDGRYNMGRSLLICGAIMGCDVRMITPPELRPPQEVIAMAHEIASTSGARITISDDVADVAGVDVVHTDVWVSMGEPVEVWAQRARLLAPFQVNADLLAMTGNPDVAIMHCLPAFHDLNTTVGRKIAAATGITGGHEVTDDVFQSPASIVFDQAENRLHTIKAILVATLA